MAQTNNNHIHTKDRVKHLFRFHSSKHQEKPEPPQSFNVQLNGPLNNQAHPTDIREITRNLHQAVQWNDPSAVHWSCIDGRENNCVFATPGGDISELLMGFGALENICGRPLTEEEVKSFFSDWMVTISPQRGFYAHTDSHAVEHLLDALGLDPSTDITKLDRPQQEKALPLITEPENIGCGHFKFALRFPDLYGLSSTLPIYYARAFFDYMWNGEHKDRINYTILTGDHNEQAVIVLKQIAGQKHQSIAPLIAPDTAGTSVFVAHAAIVHQGIRNRVAMFIAEQLKDRFNSSTVSYENIVKSIDEMAGIQMTQTVMRLAATKPLYELTIDCAGTKNQSDEAVMSSSPQQI